MILYHCNMGYPLLSEKAILKIPSIKVTPRNERAAEGIDSWDKMLKPTACFEEQCYYHKFEKEGKAVLFNPEIGQGVEISFDADNLKYFTEWKMMGEHEYVLGLEPGNCLPDGRDVMRQKGILEFLDAGEEKTHHITFEFLKN